MSIPSIEGGGTVIGILALVILEIVKQRKNNNGGNPVVRAIGTLRDSLEREQRLTQEKLQTLVGVSGTHDVTMKDQHERTQKIIADCGAATDKRLAEHEAREERKWDAVDEKLGRR